MMKITLLCIGKLKESYLVQACQEYLKRLQVYAKFTIVEVDEERLTQPQPALIQQVIEKEGLRLLQKIKKDDYVVLLSIKGQAFTSEDFASTLQQSMTQGNSSYVFVIGGSYGTSSDLEKRANLLLSLGSLTYPHQMVRLLLLEVLYRSFKIINNEPYHK